MCLDARWQRYFPTRILSSGVPFEPRRYQCDSAITALQIKAGTPPLLAPAVCGATICGIASLNMYIKLAIVKWWRVQHWWMIMTWKAWITLRKTSTNATVCTTSPTWSDLRLVSCRRGERTAANRVAMARRNDRPRPDDHSPYFLGSLAWPADLILVFSPCISCVY
jgi:hypothetical protein